MCAWCDAKDKADEALPEYVKSYNAAFNSMNNAGKRVIGWMLACDNDVQKFPLEAFKLLEHDVLEAASLFGQCLRQKEKAVADAIIEESKRSGHA